jgi:hypothetical protein
MKHVPLDSFFNTSEVAIHNKMLHKTQSNLSPSLVFADVSDNVLESTEIQHSGKYKVKFYDHANINVLNIRGWSVK